MIFGWDVSTAIIGCAVLKNDGTPVEFTFIDLRKKKEMVDKYLLAAKRISEIVSHYPEEAYHFIEDRLGGFSRGFTNQNTLLKLAQMNAVVTYQILTLEWTEIVTHIAPKSAMKLVGLKVPQGGNKKVEAVKYAREAPGFPYALKKGGNNPKDGVEDMADAYILARAGLVKRSNAA